MRYAQSVNGVVDLVGGEEVGLTEERTEPNVYVRLSDVAEVGWLWDDETQFFIPPPLPPVPEPTVEEVLTKRVVQLELELEITQAALDQLLMNGEVVI